MGIEYINLSLETIAVYREQMDIAQFQAEIARDTYQQAAIEYWRRAVSEKLEDKYLLIPRGRYQQRAYRKLSNKCYINYDSGVEEIAILDIKFYWSRSDHPSLVFLRKIKSGKFGKTEFVEDFPRILGALGPSKEYFGEP